MRPGNGHTPQLTRCLQLNALALAFSLAHAMADYYVIFTMAGFNAWGMAAYIGVSSAVYGWWGWSMARAAAGSRAALPSLQRRLAAHIPVLAAHRIVRPALARHIIRYARTGHSARRRRISRPG